VSLDNFFADPDGVTISDPKADSGGVELAVESALELAAVAAR